MSWYYRKGGGERGPIDGGELARLIEAGELSSDTEVRRDDETGFRPYADYFTSVRAIARVASPPAPDRSSWRRCAVCRRSTPLDRLVAFEAEEVCADCKDGYFQRLREGLPPTLRGFEGATLRRRLHAKLWDRVLQAFVFGALLRHLLFFTGGTPLADATCVLASAGVVLSYDVIATARGRGTLGKRVIGLRVVAEDGHAPTVPRTLLRLFCGLLDLLPLGAGYWAAFADRDHRSFGDRLSGTRVIVD